MSPTPHLHEMVLSTRSILTVSLVLKWLAPLLVILRTVSLCLDTFTDQCFIWAGKQMRMHIVERAQNYSRQARRKQNESGEAKTTNHKTH